MYFTVKKVKRRMRAKSYNYNIMVFKLFTPNLLDETNALFFTKSHCCYKCF